MIYESDDDDDLPLSKIYISTGCLLVPVFIVVWYYYTKRAFRKFFLRFLKNEPENENTSSDENGSDSREGSSSMDFSRMEDAYYNQQHQQHPQQQQQQQRDDVEHYSPTVVSDRFVKWVNRRNVFINFQEHQIKKRTKENLFGKNERTTIIGDKHDKNGDHDDDDDDDSNSTYLFWECIPNTDSQLELCVTTPTTDVQVSNNNDNENENENENEKDGITSSKSTNSNKHNGIPYDDNYLIC